VSGVVGANTHRRLNPDEFRGFALVDALAPVVFVNGADARAAQVFTLAHELAHIWAGQPGLDDIDLGSRDLSAVERWCNQVAAEFLVPLPLLADQYSPGAELTDELDRLAHAFKVSTLAILRRLHDADYLSWDRYRLAYREELARLLPLMERDRGGGGGNFYHTQPVRVSKTFARSVIASALEGQTLFTEAFRMLGVRKKATFDALAERLGVV
jgi:Zn-dependent peptidase ImmA (M78 family)